MLQLNPASQSFNMIKYFSFCILPFHRMDSIYRYVELFQPERSSMSSRKSRSDRNQLTVVLWVLVANSPSQTMRITAQGKSGIRNSRKIRFVYMWVPRLVWDRDSLTIANTSSDNLGVDSLMDGYYWICKLSGRNRSARGNLQNARTVVVFHSRVHRAFRRHGEFDENVERAVKETTYKLNVMSASVLFLNIAAWYRGYQCSP